MLLAKIHSLPGEVLIKLLLLSVDAESETYLIGYYSDVLKLSLICKYLHSLVWDTPSFWTVISATSPIALCNLALDLSQEHNINITYHPMKSQTGYLQLWDRFGSSITR